MRPSAGSVNKLKRFDEEYCTLKTCGVKRKLEEDVSKLPNDVNSPSNENRLCKPSNVCCVYIVDIYWHVQNVHCLALTVLFVVTPSEHLYAH